MKRLLILLSICGTLLIAHNAPAPIYPASGWFGSNVMNKATADQVRTSLGVAGLTNSFGAAIQYKPEDFKLEKRAPTPWLGWNTYFGMATNLTASGILTVAQRWQTNGMLKAGWNYICLDEWWPMPSLGEDNELVPRPDVFPNGIQSYVNELHAMGFKAGSYVTWGPNTCSDQPTGSWSYEAQHVAQIAGWGFDLLKVDSCGGSAGTTYSDLEQPMRKWGNLLSWPNVQRPIVLCMSMEYVTRYTPSYLNSWQSPHGPWFNGTDSVGRIERFLHLATNAQYTTTLITPGGIESAGSEMSGDEYHGKPGRYRDNLSLNANLDYPTTRSVVSAAAMFVQPILLQFDETATTLPCFTNREVLDIHQDPLCRQATWFAKTNLVSVYQRQLSELGHKAVLFWNTNITDVAVTITWSDFGFTRPVSIRDVWAGEYLAASGSSMSAGLGAGPGSTVVTVPKTNCMLLRVWEEPATDSVYATLYSSNRFSDRQTFTRGITVTGGGISATNIANNLTVSGTLETASYATIGGALAAVVLKHRDDNTDSTTIYANAEVLHISDNSPHSMLMISNNGGQLNFFSDANWFTLPKPWGLPGAPYKFYGSNSFFQGTTTLVGSGPGSLTLSNYGTTAGNKLRMVSDTESMFFGSSSAGYGGIWGGSTSLVPDGNNYLMFFGNASGSLSLWLNSPSSSGTLHLGNGNNNRAIINSSGLTMASGLGVALDTTLIRTGSASPEGAVTAPVGSIYLRTGGGAGTTFYVKESGSGNTGWVGK